MPHRVREKEHGNSKQQQEHGNADNVLDRVIGVEGNGVLPALGINANRVV